MITAIVQASITMARHGAQGKAPLPTVLVEGNKTQLMVVQPPPKNDWLQILDSFVKNSHPLLMVRPIE